MKVTKRVTVVLDMVIDVSKLSSEYDVSQDYVLSELNTRINVDLTDIIEKETKTDYSKSLVTEVSIEEI